MDNFTITQEPGFQSIHMKWSAANPGFLPSTFDVVTRALRKADSDPNIACTVFFGVPRCFCLGTNVEAFADLDHSGQLSEIVQLFFQALINAKKPLIAAVDGTSVGLGMTMLCHFDAVFATPESLFKAPFVEWGLCPEAASSLLLPEALGYRKAFDIFCLGWQMTAAEAEQLGFITRVVPRTEVDQTTRAAARRLSQLSEKSLAVTRELMRHQRTKLVRRSKTETTVFQSLLNDVATQRRLKVMSRATKMLLAKDLPTMTA